jgi:hypothetical protein
VSAAAEAALIAICRVQSLRLGSPRGRLAIRRSSREFLSRTGSGSGTTQICYLRVSTWPGFAPTSTALQPRTPLLVPDSPRAQPGVIDTSGVIDLEQLEADQLPFELAVIAITMTELAAGPHATGDADERARRQERLQRAEAAFDPLPFDREAARAYGADLRCRSRERTPSAWRTSSGSPDRGNSLCRRTPALYAQPGQLPKSPGARRCRRGLNGRPATERFAQAKLVDLGGHNKNQHLTIDGPALTLDR